LQGWGYRSGFRIVSQPTFPVFRGFFFPKAQKVFMYQVPQNEQRRSFWRVRFFVAPNEIGYLFRRNRLEKKLEAGIYDYFDYENVLRLVNLPLSNRIQNIINQEVLTKDNVALRFSFFVEYKIVDSDTFIEKHDVFANPYNLFFQTEQIIHNLSQVAVRKLIAEIESEDLNEKRNEILTEIPAELKNDLKSYGIEIVRLLLKDLTFPKTIQDLFAKQLEAKIRAKSDLENARTQVATARTLKNAAELMKGDENIKFVQMLETITKIAEKGKHTFIIGDLAQNAVNLKKD
jgi:regulator of protease activity HflC (stomatin/prohibitin superfamily)